MYENLKIYPFKYNHVFNIIIIISMSLDFKNCYENYKINLNERKIKFEKYLLKFVLKHIKSKHFISNYHNNINYYFIEFENKIFFPVEIFTTIKE